jgi:enoyl-CoA hydratase
MQNDSTLLIELNRPKALNALCDSMIDELNETLSLADNTNDVRTVVLTGSPRAFAAGADIKEMVDRTYADTYTNQMLGHWDQITQFR